MNTASRYKRRRLIAEINITPFTDVILVLLIIFMITTPLIVQSSIKVNLPESTNAKPLKNTKQAKISLTSEGVIYLDDKPLTRRELKEQIIKMHTDNPDLGVALYCDKLTKFKDVVNVLDILNEIGIKSLNIAVKTEE